MCVDIYGLDWFVRCLCKSVCVYVCVCMLNVMSRKWSIVLCCNGIVLMD